MGNLLCEIILKLGPHYRSTSRHFVQLNSFGEDNLCVIIFEFEPEVQEKVAFKEFSIFSSGGHFIQQNGTVWVILVEGLMRKTSVKLYFEFGPAV